MLPLSEKGQIKVSVDSALSVVLSEKAFWQLSGYVACAGTEISCLGAVKREGSRFFVEEFFLVAQEGSSARTEMDVNALAETVAELCSQGRSDAAASLKCWAHSHPGMGLFWSKTDEETCRGLCSDWLVSVVVDEHCRALARIDVFQPLPATFDNVPVLVRMDACADTLEQCRKEVQEKVKHRPECWPRKAFKAGQFGSVLGDEDEEDGRKFAGISRFCPDCGSWHRRGECPLAGQGELEWAEEFADEESKEKEADEILRGALGDEEIEGHGGFW